MGTRSEREASSMNTHKVVLVCVVPENSSQKSRKPKINIQEHGTLNALDASITNSSSPFCQIQGAIETASGQWSRRSSFGRRVSLLASGLPQVSLIQIIEVKACSLLVETPGQHGKSGTSPKVTTK